MERPGRLAKMARMSREPISTAGAPKAIGPYSQAIAARGQRIIYCSGQIPLDPQTGELTGAGDVKLETHRVMQNLKAVLEAAGASLAAVVKTTIYLTDLQSFALVNEVYASYFAEHPEYVQFADQASRVVEVPNVPNSTEIWQEFRNAWTASVVFDDESIDKAFADAAERANELLAEE